MQKDPSGNAAGNATVTRYACQRSEELPEDTMDFLRSIAADYAKVKTAVYERYSGIRSMNRLTPVYAVQSEMRACGFRTQLNLPVVYYELAVAEAVANIKAMWGQTKERIRRAVRDKETLTSDERMYIRTVLRLESIFFAILNRRTYEMPRKMEGIAVDVGRLNNLICQLVRRYRVKPRIRNAMQFKVSPLGYRYQDGGIYLVSRVPRRRVFLPLRDKQVSSRQIRINIAESNVRIHIPVDVEVGRDMNPGGTVYIYIGYRDALTLSNGHIYGKDLDRLVSLETERLSAKNAERNKLYAIYEKNRAAGNNGKASCILRNNLGKKKYDAQKVRVRERTQNYINAELNRMIAEENPGCIVITKPVKKQRARFHAKELNRKRARSFTGYIRKRLAEKCSTRGIQLITVSSKDIRSSCSRCGSEGTCDRDGFHCTSCGYHATVVQNSAGNIEKKASKTKHD